MIWHNIHSYSDNPQATQQDSSSRTSRIYLHAAELSQPWWGLVHGRAALPIDGAHVLAPSLLLRSSPNCNTNVLFRQFGFIPSDPAIAKYKNVCA